MGRNSRPLRKETKGKRVASSNGRGITNPFEVLRVAEPGSDSRETEKETVGVEEEENMPGNNLGGNLDITNSPSFFSQDSGQLLDAPIFIEGDMEMTRREWRK